MAHVRSTGQFEACPADGCRKTRNEGGKKRKTYLVQVVEDELVPARSLAHDASAHRHEIRRLLPVLHVAPFLDVLVERAVVLVLVWVRVTPLVLLLRDPSLAVLGEELIGIAGIFRERENTC